MQCLSILLDIALRISIEAVPCWRNFSRRTKAARGGVGGFPGQQTKRKTIPEALKIYSGLFFSGKCSYVPPPSLFFHVSLSQCALLWPNPSLILHFTPTTDDFTVVTEL